MSKFTALLCSAFLGLTMTSQAQTFINPVYPETISVPSTSGIVSRIQHTSCYSVANINVGSTVNNNLYVYSWNAPNTGGTLSGIGFYRRDATDAIILDQGVIPKPGALRDLEVAIVQDAGNVYVLASYYDYGAVGHIYDVYLWTPTGLSPFSMGNVLSSGKYGRISLDAHKLYGAAITWNVNGRIYVKAFYSSGAGITIGNSVQITNVPSTAIIPDVAFGHASDLNIRIVFLDYPTGNIHVMLREFFTVLGAGPTIAFAPEDVNPGAYPGANPSDDLLAPNNLNLDCPDHFSADNWSYIYLPNPNTVRARLRTASVSGTPFTVGLNAGLTGVSNYNPTIGYDQSSTRIRYGWFTDYGNARGYVSTTKSDNGVSGMPAGTYNIVSNYGLMAPGGTISTPVMSFTKQNDMSNQFFCVYPVFVPSSGVFDVRTKLVPWTAPSFRPGAEEEPATPLLTTAGDVAVWPNPFSSSLRLEIPADNGSGTYSVGITDIGGRNVRKAEGSLNVLNADLGAWAAAAPAGIYMLQVRSGQDGKVSTLKIVKY